MTHFELQRRKIDKKDFLRKSAEEAHTEHVYSEPGLYCLEGKPVIIYGRLHQRHDRMLWAVKTIGYQTDSRSTNGGKLGDYGRERLGESRIIGFRPRIPFGANYCSVCSASQTHPKQHSIICEFGMLLNALYERAAPGEAAFHSSELSNKISADWIIPGTRFTSGIVNQNNPLKYHYDRGNLKNVMSCMAVFRNMVDGGYLSIPEFNARWLLDDHSYFFFDGQSFLHGVTPIRKLNKKAYRYSVVYYALRGMEKCGSLEEEISRASAEKRARECRRASTP